MMGEYYYSAKTKGFYLGSDREVYESSSNGWPDDAVGITDEKYNALLEGQTVGKIIIADDEGGPVLIDPPELTHDELVSAAEARRKYLMIEIAGSIAPLQDAADMGIATKKEQSKLIELKKYRIHLSRIDTNVAPDIIWPEKPL